MSNKVHLNDKFKTIPGSNAIVYGAQHPPSIKAIQEIANDKNKKLANTSTSSNQYSTTTTATKFKEFEKNTINDWDINSSNSDTNNYDYDLDDDPDNCNIDNDFDEDDVYLNDNFLTISIEDSNEVAKRIIKDHSDKQKKNLFNKLYNSKASFEKSQNIATNIPGKAFRQQEQNNLENQNFNNFKSNTLKIDSSNNDKKTVNINNNTLQPQQQSTTLATNQSNASTYNTSNTSRYSSRESDEKFKNLLAANPINLEELQKASWKGIPKAYRPISWKLLSDYLPLKVELQEKTIEQKRNSYWELVNEYYSKTYLDAHHDTLRQILNDLPRMNPLMPLFQKKSVQDIFQRILYVWSVRHPASGYVQGINDLVTPFFAVFLTEYLDINDKSSDVENLDIANLSEKDLRQLEADCYGCMTKLLDRIQENYVFSQPGIQKQVQALEELIKRIDEPLHRHLKKNHIEFLQFAFRWMNNLLMREIPLQCIIRLWDTYHAEPFGFSDFHLYVCAAFLLRFSKDLLKQKDFQDLMLFLQNLPTRSWNSNDITLLTAEAYKLQFMFANAPKHIKSTNTSKNKPNNE